MNAVFLAANPNTAPTPASAEEVRLTLESLDGLKRLPLDDSAGWRALAGATGLEMPPVDVITDGVPGVSGSVLRDVRVAERPVFLPIFAQASDGRFVTHLAMVNRLMDLVDPLNGEFRIVGSTPASERALTVIYTDGLQGAYGTDQFGTSWRKFGLTAVACDPFAYDRDPRVVEFQVDPGNAPFLGVVGGTDAPWPGSLSSGTVIGSGMRIRVDSEVPVYPTLELVGPMDSFTGSMSTGWSVSVPGGVTAGSTLRIVTDPRARSIRLDGALAAGRVARGSTLRPFYPGTNNLDVTAPGGSEATRVRLSWTEAHRSLW